MAEAPAVSILLPVRNEAEHIDDVLSDLLSQDYDGALEVIVADGLSDDDTPARVEEWAASDSRVRLVSNDAVHQAHGLNLAASLARSAILVRADGHTRYEPDYVKRSLMALEELGGAVGGPMNPVGTGSFERSVAAAMNSPLTMGPGRFHHATECQEVDTVYLGCFLKADFEDIGGFRHFPSGSSEDADFYHRWRMLGRTVWVDPSIRSYYTPRGTFRSLFRQYRKYGQGKSEMLWANGRLPSLRPLAPLGLVLALVAGLAIWLFGGPGWPLALLLTSWFLLLAWVGLRSDEPAVRVIAVAATMHIAYGLGMVAGFIRGPRQPGGDPVPPPTSQENG